MTKPRGGRKRSSVARERGLFCNRTLNLRTIRAIGYDMDYTLIHYRIEEWERRAYEYVRAKLIDLGWPVSNLEFDPTLVIRGLILDLEHGNVLKCNRFGYVKRAYHGTREMGYDEQRRHSNLAPFRRAVSSAATQVSSSSPRAAGPGLDASQ